MGIARPPIRHLILKNESGARARKNGECTTAYTERYNRVAIRRLESLPPTVNIHGTDNWKNAVMKLLKHYVDNGMKMSKKELLEGFKALLKLLKQGSSNTGAMGVDTGEPPSSHKKKTKYVKKDKAKVGKNVKSKAVDVKSKATDVKGKVVAYDEQKPTSKRKRL